MQDGSNALQSNDVSIPILIADDSKIVRRGIRQLLLLQTDIAIVGEAVNFAQTIRMAIDFEPQVIVMDLHMPDEDNVTPQDLKSRLNHGSQILAISIWNDESSKELAGRFGAAVLLDKMSLASTLIPTIMQLQRTSIANWHLSDLGRPATQNSGSGSASSPHSCASRWNPPVRERLDRCQS
jgi:two-component system nitrate/nitrite response regulator NarL